MEYSNKLILDRNFLFESLTDTEKSALAGGVAGTVAKTATAPLSRLTILFQVHSVLAPTRNFSRNKHYATNLFTGFARLLREEGILAFWKVVFDNIQFV